MSLSRESAKDDSLTCAALLESETSSRDPVRHGTTSRDCSSLIGGSADHASSANDAQSRGALTPTRLVMLDALSCRTMSSSHQR